MKILAIQEGEGTVLPYKKGSSPDGWGYQKADATGLLINLEPLDGTVVILSQEVLESFGYKHWTRYAPAWAKVEKLEKP
jgi:hypothetical protein